MKINKKEKKDLEPGFKSEEDNFPLIARIIRQIAVMIAKKLINTKITANQVTIFGFVTLALSAYFFFRADYISLIIAAVLLQIGVILDDVDGSLARMRNSANKYGHWLDELSGTYGYALIYIGITLGVYNQTHNQYIIMFGLFAALATAIKNTTQNLFLTEFKFASEFGQKVYKKAGFIMFFRYTSPFIRTLFTFGALFNKLYWVIIFCGIYGPIYTIIQNTIFTLKIKKNLKEEKNTRVNDS